jgi:hypothetical protein
MWGAWCYNSKINEGVDDNGEQIGRMKNLHKTKQCFFACWMEKF